MPEISDELSLAIETLKLQRSQAQAELDRIMEDLRKAMLKLLASGVSQVQAAKLVGVDRMTARRWIAKVEPWKASSTRTLVLETDASHDALVSTLADHGIGQNSITVCGRLGYEVRGGQEMRAIATQLRLAGHRVYLEES